MEENRNEILENVNEMERLYDERVNIRTSKTLEHILPGLLKFHKKMDSIEKSSANPFFKSKYTNLDTILEHIKPLLAEEGIFIYQSIIDGGNDMLSIKTILFHESGEYIESDSVPFPIDKKNIQGTMSSISYIRRYAINSVCNLAFKDEDDDGNMASQSQPTSTPAAPATERTSARSGRRSAR